MGILTALSLFIHFFDQEFWIDWCRANFGIEFSFFWLIVKFHTEKTGSCKSFALRIRFFKVAPERIFTIVNAKQSLKSLFGILMICNLRSPADSCHHLIVVTPLKGFLPNCNHFTHF